MNDLFKSSDFLVGQHIRFYRQLLLKASSGIALSEFDKSYKTLAPLIHSQINSQNIDSDLLNYVQKRLPDVIQKIRRIIISSDIKTYSSNFNVDQSIKVFSPARRRLIYYDGDDSLFVLLNSLTDLDDLITSLSAYRLESLKNKSNLTEFNPLIVSLGVNESDFINQADNWWQNNISRSFYFNLSKEPVYFVSSNIHSLVNIMGGFFSKKKNYIFDFVAAKYPEIYKKWFDLKVSQDIYQTNDFLYYLSENFLSQNQEFVKEKNDFESKMGIIKLPAGDFIPIDMQIIPLKIFANSPYLDDNLRLEPGLFANKTGVIVNIQYPLGMAAKYILNSFFKYFSSPRGVYIIGKAAILNGQVGDIQIPNIVQDEFTNNIYKFNNIFNSFFPFKNNISQVFQNQKAVCVHSTLLETKSQIENYKETQSNIIEMESGHYLASIFEKFVVGGTLANSFYYTANGLPIDLGIINYASDNPLTENLTQESIDFRGIETTYLSSLSVIQRIIDLESKK